MNSYFNGEYMPLDDVRISPLDFGFIHSHATYDVMRGLTFFDKHWERFTASCEYYGFAIPDKEQTLKVIQELLDGDMFVWLIKWKGTPPSGSPRDLTAPEHFLIYTKPYYKISSKPVTVKIVDDLPRSAGYQQYKNFSWIELTRAQQQAENYDTAIVRSTDGWINEGPGFGICFIKDGIVYTPKTDVLPSVTISVVEEICLEMRMPFVRADFSKHKDFEECFLCSTSGGITPVSKINETTYTSKTTEIIKAKYDSLY